MMFNISLVKIILKYLSGVLIVLYLAFVLDLSASLPHLSTLSGLEIILILSSSLALICCQAWRLHVLLSPFISGYATTLNLSFVSQLFSNFLPGGTAGDVYKLMYLSQTTASRSEAFTFIALDRFAGLFIFGLASVCMFPYILSDLGDVGAIQFDTSRVLYVLTGLMLVGLVLACSQVLKRKFISVLRSVIKSYRSIPADRKVAFFIVSIITFFVRVVKINIIVWIFVPQFHWQYVVLLVFVIHLVAMTPFSIGSLGTMEGAIVASLVMFNVAADIGVSIAIVYRLSIWFLSLCGLVVWLLTRNKITNKRGTYKNVT